MNPQVFASIEELRQALARERLSGSRIGLVPTMGALHAGHVRLIEAARSECELVVVSIFVNPIQFDRQDDFERYPRPVESDLLTCGQSGAAIVFSPSAKEMYGSGNTVHVEPGPLAAHLCGKFRPGHFRGVATVVLKLFNIVRPDRAYFGEKDFQQLALIRRMVDDLNVAVEIRPVPTVREPDGLAMSSRNRHLSPSEREAAPVIFRSLLLARNLIGQGLRDPSEVRSRAAAGIEANPLCRLEYFEIVDPSTVQPVGSISGPVRIAVAAWLGSTRLIDNVEASHLPT